MKNYIIFILITFFAIKTKAQTNDSLKIIIISSQFATDTSYVNGHHLFTHLQLVNANNLKTFAVTLLNESNASIGKAIIYELKTFEGTFLYVQNNLSEKYSVLNNTIEFNNTLSQANFLTVNKIKINYVDINNLQHSVISAITK